MPGFTTKYGCKLLVWYEVHDNMTAAIEREKQIKGGSRAKKVALIEALNPEWKDLYEHRFDNPMWGTFDQTANFCIKALAVQTP